MAYEATGTVYAVLETEQVTDTFRKRVIVLTCGSDKYPQTVAFEFTGDNTDKLDGIEAGQTATIKFDLGGREWTSPKGDTRYFVSLRGWHIDTEGAGAPDVADEDIPF